MVARMVQARELMREQHVPVIVEVILERVTNIAMGTELDNIMEFGPTVDDETQRLVSGAAR
ncbi:MAG: hypothetical protein ACXVH1_39915 [Solirubrobacteraceae bacterium]